MQRLAKIHNIEIPESYINIDEILENSVERDTQDLLLNISEEIVESMMSISLSVDLMAEFCSKLVEYRFVDKIFQLQKGKHVRWIRKGNLDPTLTNGGILMDIKFTNKGVSILCKNKNRFIQYGFDDCLTYQKLSPDELMLIGCMKLAI
jgi:hypothetical protein